MFTKTYEYDTLNYWMDIFSCFQDFLTHAKKKKTNKQKQNKWKAKIKSAMYWTKLFPELCSFFFFFNEILPPFTQKAV